MLIGSRPSAPSCVGADGRRRRPSTGGLVRGERLTSAVTAPGAVRWDAGPGQVLWTAVPSADGTVLAGVIVADGYRAELAPSGRPAARLTQAVALPEPTQCGPSASWPVVFVPIGGPWMIKPVFTVNTPPATSIAK